MPDRYSFSKIESFKQCRLQFKYKYVDRLPMRVETIEAFMGSRVHEALKEFYDFVKSKIVKPQEWLLSKYEELWKKEYKDTVKIVKNEFSADDYYQRGMKCLIDYYQEYKPFSQAKVVKTEESIFFSLKEKEAEFPFQGVLDRIDWNDREEIFEIHDYKTSATLVTQDEADKDLQLPLYQLALLSRWPEARRTKLVWHYLLFNKQVESRRTENELIEVQAAAVARIKEIESCDDFPPEKSELCGWCDFQEICPLWKHPKLVEKLDENKYKSDPGVKLVIKYSELEEEKKGLRKKISELEQEQEKIAEAAIELAEKDNISVIDGPGRQLVVTVRDELYAPSRAEDPERWEGLRKFLVDSDHFVEVSTVNNSMLNRMLRTWPHDFIKKIKAFLNLKKVKKVDLRNKS